MNLDIYQKQLYDYEISDNKVAICLVAGAGAGKTSTIIQKIVKMITDGAKSEHFFITTFTRAAAKELRDRLIKYLDEKIVENMIIGTFHKIAGMYLDKYGINDEILISSYDESLYLYGALISKPYYLETHKYIFIDEYQDINESQEKIIENLYKKCDLLVTIGDDQQNIYTFRQSDIKYMLNFVNKYNGVYMYLTTNYRCPTPIVEMSNTILSRNKNKIDKHFTSASNIDNKIILLPLKMSDYDIIFNNNLIAKMILKKIKYLMQMQPVTNIVIISRYNDILKYMETYLIRKGIYPHYYDSNDTTISHNKIILSTIHGTKGLEFDHEIFIDFIPNKCTNNNELEEERRLFYVAITRAKIELTIIYNEHNPSYFLRECWFIESVKNLFINLPTNYEQHLINYNFTCTKIYQSYDILKICDNLSYNDIINLNKIISFKYWINKSNGLIQMTQIHAKINISIYDITSSITGCDHLINIVIKNYILYKLCCLNDKPIYLFEPIKCIIYDNIGTIQHLNINTYDIFIKKFKSIYGINFSVFDANRNEFINEIKKYARLLFKIRYTTLFNME